VTVFDGGAGLVRSAAFHPGGGHLASAGEDGVVRLFETATWQAARTFTHKVANPWNLSLAKITAFDALFTAAMCVNFRPDGRDLAVANGDGTVSLWNLAQGTEVVLPFIDPTEWNGVVASVAYAPNGGTIAAVYDSAAVRIWRTGDQTTVANLATGAGYWIAQVAYHPAGGLLASASGNGNPGNGVGDGLLELWDPTSGSKITTLADTNSPEGQLLAFSPDGKTLANVRSDGQTTLWDVAAQSARTVLTPAGSGASCVAFGPGGLLATGFTDGTVTVWSARSGKALATLTTRSDSKVHSVAFSPDARYLAATTSRLSVWTLRS
jgi:WD40 repeat protein